MAMLNFLLSVSEPSGFWETIIKAFENGVGSYILAIVLITLIIRVIWAPFDVFNKKINKKNARIQAKLQPELDKLKARYGNDKNLLNQKTQELYKKNNYSMGGSCLFMLVFMALNLAIFFTLFAGLNGIADYKISQQYDYLKYNYANVLNLTNENIDNTEFLNDYENVTFLVEGDKLIATYGDGKTLETAYKTDFATYKQKVDDNGDVVSDDSGEPVMVVDKTSDEVIESLVKKLVTETKVKNENDEEIVDPNYVGEKQLKVDGENVITYKNAIDTFATNYIKTCYENAAEKPQFLWIENYWIADSPFKRSIFSYKDFVNEIGSNNVSAQEETIYNAFMPNLDAAVGRVNGYLILAVLSVVVSFLSVFLGNLGNKKKGEKTQAPAGGKVMMFVMPIIMGIFAIFYNSVFAIYLVVSQAISAILAPIENLIINKCDAHDEKKKEEKQKSVVSYRRK